MTKLNFFKTSGSLIIITSLLSFSWYNIVVQPKKDLWYIIRYSPFFFEMTVGQTVDYQWLYRLDSTIMGIIIILTLIYLEFFTNTKKTTFFSTLILFLVSILYISLLPIHVTTASRLELGNGIYLYWFGIVVIFLDVFSEIRS